jgi:hypothetical protein
MTPNTPTTPSISQPAPPASDNPAMTPRGKPKPKPAGPFDIGRIDSDPAGKRFDDSYEAARGRPADYRVFSPNFVLYYGNKCIKPISQAQVLDFMKCLEANLTGIETLFGLSRVPNMAHQRFSVYMSHSGLGEPVDLPPGTTGAANEFKLIFYPDNVQQSFKQPYTIMHELGHALLHVEPWKNSWLEESLCEYLVHQLAPDFDSAYVRAKTFVYKTPYVNLLSAKTCEAHRYDFAVFWQFVAWKCGGPKAVGDVADCAFTGAGTVDDLWGCLAAYLKRPLADVHRDWVAASLDLAFWRADPVRAKLAARVLGGPSDPKKVGPPFAKDSLVWTRPTCTSVEQAAGRLERFGFEVLDLPASIAGAPAQAPQIPARFGTQVHLYVYEDGSHSVLAGGGGGPDPAKAVKRHLLAFGFV